MITVETANEFINNFFNKNEQKDYLDCTRKLAKQFDIDFQTAFCYVVNYLNKYKYWEVK